jgi:hypothetical protein
MAGSWDLFEPWFRSGFSDDAPLIRLGTAGEAGPLIGAAYAASLGYR